LLNTACTVPPLNVATPPKLVNLVRGDVIVGEGNTVVSTILGSCIAVCLWDRRQRRGGMNHYIFPKYDGLGSPLNYGDTAIEQLVAEMAAPAEALIAAIFGGAARLGLGSAVYGKNAEVARDTLKHLGIRLVADHTGGSDGYRVSFHLADGQIRSDRVVTRSIPSRLCIPLPPDVSLRRLPLP